MDNFMDKLAQKFNASELIKANSQAEAEEMKRLQKQIAAYEGILQEMRKLNLKNVEVSEQIETQVGCLAEANAILKEIKTIQLENQKEDKTETTDMTPLIEEIKKILQEGQQKIEEQFKAADEYVHKENVKVYRNVQAVIVDEIKTQTEGISEETANLDKKISLMKILTFGTIALSVTNTILLVVQMFF